MKACVCSTSILQQCGKEAVSTAGAAAHWLQVHAQPKRVRLRVSALECLRAARGQFG